MTATPTADRINLPSVKATRAQLAGIMFANLDVPVGLSGRLVVVHSVEKEDGSGRSFNVYGRTAGRGTPFACYVRVTD